jgi:hypothetical protein
MHGSCKHVHGRNHSLGAFEEGCWKDFRKLVSNYIEASKRLKIKCHTSRLFKTFEKYRHTHKKLPFKISLSLNKYPSRET